MRYNLLFTCIGIGVVGMLCGCMDLAGLTDGNATKTRFNFTEYFPLQAGTQWLEHRGSTWMLTTIQAQTTINGQPAMPRHRKNAITGSSEGIDYQWIDATMIRNFGWDDEGKANRFAPPADFPSDLTTGQTITRTGNWLVDGVKAGPYTMTVTVVGAASLTVPAGTFSDCLVLSIEQHWAGDETERSKMWFARGVGCVQTVDLDTDTTTVLAGALVQGTTYGSLSPGGANLQGNGDGTTLNFLGVDSGTGSGTMTLQHSGSQVTYTGFNAAPPDFASVGHSDLVTDDTTVGSHFTSAGITNSLHYSADVVVTSVTETVITPAGTFTNCLRIDETLTYADPAQSLLLGGNLTLSRTRWFARGVGPVKYAATYQDSTKTFTNTGVLQSVTIPTLATDWWPLQTGAIWVFQESDMSTTTTWMLR
jgi:hypothetical protein